MDKTADEQERRLAQLKREVTRRGFDRHAHVLRDVSELPGELQTAAVSELANRETIQRILLFPPQIRRGWDYVPKQALLFTQRGVLHLTGSIWPDEKPRAAYLRACNLMYMEITLILLYGFLDILAHGEATPTHLNVEFNTVAWCLLTKPLHSLLPANIAPSWSQAHEPEYSAVMHHAMRELPVKFANGVKIYGLLPGEQLEELVFQPGTSQRWLHFFQRPLTPNTLLLLTNHYVVLIREDLNTKQGWILKYIPRECIVDMQTQRCDLCNELVIRLKRDDQMAQYKLFLASKAVEAWHSRWIEHGGQWAVFPGKILRF